MGGLFLFLFPLIALFFAYQLEIFHYYTEHKSIPYWEFFPTMLSYWYLWILFFFLIWLISQRYSPEKKKWLLILLVHIPLSLIIPLGHLALTFAFLKIFGFKENFPVFMANWYMFDVVVYWLATVFVYLALYYRLYRTKELAAAKMETQLAAAQLMVLKGQVHPHFLFNTLNSIMVLMHEDIRAAEKMITHLSDFLRYTLENTGQHEVLLWQEVQFIKRYLDIEKVRFRDRLAVRMDIDAQTLSARVPSLILQPLVENSIRHGIVSFSRNGEIVIVSKREGDHLVLQVEDNGPGFTRQPDGQFKRGIGLSNIEARLQKLYGKKYRFEVGNAPGGGALVKIVIPFIKSEPQEKEALNIA